MCTEWFQSATIQVGSNRSMANGKRTQKSTPNSIFRYGIQMWQVIRFLKARKIMKNHEIVRHFFPVHKLIIPFLTECKAVSELAYCQRCCKKVSAINRRLCIVCVCTTKVSNEKAKFASERCFKLRRRSCAPSSCSRSPKLQMPIRI